MAVLPLRELGSIGMITDVEPYNLPENAWTDAYNVRFRNGNVEKMKGWAEVLEATAGSPTLWFTFFKNELFYIQYDGIYRYDGATTRKLDVSIDETDPINPVLTQLDLTYTNASECSSAIVQDRLYINIKGLEYAPFVYSASLNRLISLTAIPSAGSSAAWDVTWTSAFVRGYKQTLMTFNNQEGNLYYYGRYRYSGVIRPNEVADDWDATDDRGTAGFNDITGLATQIIDAQSLGDNMIIYAENQTYLMTFLGDADAPFKVHPLFLDSGVISHGGVVEFDGNHLVVGKNDIYVHNGATRQSIAEGRIRDFFFDDINSSYAGRIKCVYNPAKQEVWICYPAQDSVTGELTKMLIWNHKDNVWSTAQIPSALHISLIEASIVTVEGIDAPITWDGSTYVNGRTYAESDVIAYPSPADWYNGSYDTIITSNNVISAIAADTLTIADCADDGFIVGDTIHGVTSGGTGVITAVDNTEVTVGVGEGASFTVDDRLITEARHIPLNDISFDAAVKLYAANKDISVASAPPPSADWTEVPEHNTNTVYGYTDRVLIKETLDGIDYFKVYAPSVASTATIPAGTFRPTQWTLLTTTWTNEAAGNIETWEYGDTGTSVSNNILCSTKNADFQLMDIGYTHAGQPYTSFVEKNLSDYSTQGFTYQQVKYISRIYPQMIGESTLYFALRGSMTAGTTINPPARIPTYEEGQYKVDLRVAGRYISTRIQSVDTGYWKLSGMDLEITERGVR